MIYLYLSLILLPSLVLLYRRALPKPYDGIPYNKHSARRIMGDLPDVIAHLKRTKEMSSFAFGQCRKLKSPIIQLFLRPFSQPFIFLNDPREIEDILLRRIREFDRAPTTIDYFKPLLPNASIVKVSDSSFKEQRRLWQDVMSPQFLRTVVAKNVHESALDLIDLWRRKCTLANGSPFEAAEDLEISAFDAIWVAMLGTKLGGMNAEIQALAGYEPLISLETDLPISFPVAPRSVLYKAITYINSTVEQIMKSPFPVKHHWLIRKTTQYRRYNSFKDGIIDDLVTASRSRYEGSKDENAVREEHDTCAMDLVLRREAIAFSKTGAYSPASGKFAMRDELTMLLVAGHETTATTLAWGVKQLAGNQNVQSELRSALQVAFKSKTPSALDILNTSIPYLDGALEEMLRFSNTVPLLVRSATVDTEILGYHIPKGAHIMCNAQFMDEPLQVPEELRSPSSQAAEKRRSGPFCMQELSKFRPERWIETLEDGSRAFNGSALTRLAFSLGPRGCFGRRLAVQELRITLTLLVLNFQFLEISQALDSPSGHQKILRHPQQCYVRLCSL